MKTVISGRDAGPYIKNRIHFKTPSRHFRGIPCGNGNYEVWSYGTMIAEYYDGVWYINDTTYSITTSQQQQEVRWAISSDGGRWNDSFWVNNTIHINRGCYYGCSSLHDKVRGKVALQRADRIRRENKSYTGLTRLAKVV